MSCDNIGSFVPPIFNPEFKKDPYHIPGYQGFVPQFKYKSEGKTFANATKSLFENPCVASSGKLVLADVEGEDAASIIKPGFECKVWEEETKRCRDIQARCLPGCYNQQPAQYPQSYLSFLQPANVAFDECRRSPSKPEVAAGCRGNVGNRAPGMGFISTNAGCGQIQRVNQMGDRSVGVKRGGGNTKCAKGGGGNVKGVVDPRSGVVDPRSGAVDPRSGVVDPHSGVVDPRYGNQTRKQFLICPSQTVYDPRTGSRYFIFSQQNTRNCGEIAPRPVPTGNCVSISSCKEICPCPQTQLKIRQLYPECGGMMSGYGGHVPGLNDCTLGDNYKKATAKVLKQVVGGKREYPGPWTLKLPDCGKTQKSRSKCGRSV